MSRGLVVSCALVCVMAPAVWAMWVNSPEPVPVERLIANLTRHVERDPKDAKAHFALGRVRSFAYAQAAETVNVTNRRDDGEKEWDKDDDTAREVPEIWHQEPIVLELNGDVDAKRIEHFKQAVLHLRLAAELDPKKSVHHLGLAWLLDSGSDLAPRLGWPDGVERKSDLTESERAVAEKDLATLIEHGESPEHFRRLRKLGPRAMPLVVPARSDKSRVRPAVDSLVTACWKDLAFESYRAAFRLALPEERKRESFDMEGPRPVTTEAGEAILRLLDERQLAADDAAALRKEVEDGVREIASKGKFITPVIFPVSGNAPLADLVPAGRTALFDLDGDDVVERWPWPSADAAILVWRPDPEVPVTSGRQLFGSRTWWIFWTDGYEPLAALDDDGDGRLAGAELDGICVWRDRDGNAREDAGEVVTAAAFGVASIATQPDAEEDGVPACRLGVVMTDGSTRPTYDWTPCAVPEPSQP